MLILAVAKGASPCDCTCVEPRLALSRMRIPAALSQRYVEQRVEDLGQEPARLRQGPERVRELSRVEVLHFPCRGLEPRVQIAEGKGGNALRHVRQRQSRWRRLLDQHELCVHHDVRPAGAAGRGPLARFGAGRGSAASAAATRTSRAWCCTSPAATAASASSFGLCRS